MSVRILRKGSKGEDVRAVQNALNRNGAGLDPDADFGNNTRDAVIAFQKKQRESDPKFQVDGEVGPETRRALFPLIGVTVTVYGTRFALNPAQVTRKPWFEIPPLTLGQPDPQPPQPRLKLDLPPTTFSTLSPERVPGLWNPSRFRPFMLSVQAAKLPGNR